MQQQTVVMQEQTVDLQQIIKSLPMSDRQLISDDLSKIFILYDVPSLRVDRQSFQENLNSHLNTLIQHLQRLNIPVPPKKNKIWLEQLRVACEARG